MLGTGAGLDDAKIDQIINEVDTNHDGEIQFDDYVASGPNVPEFFYVRVTQGDGDRAWSAPIWLNHPRP